MVVNIFELKLPFRGVIAAGWPSPAEEELGDTLSFEDWLVPHKESSFLVTVGTNTLKKEGILANDTVIMERGRSAQHGDIVIVEVDEDLLIRKYEKLSGVFRLTSDSGTLKIEEDSNVRILGVVTSVIRRYR